MFNLKLSLFILIIKLIVLNAIKYEPKWNSLDNRPLPKWFDESKIGIFIHWGVFSVPSYKTEWFWKHLDDDVNSKDFREFLTKNYPPKFVYQDFANYFKAELFNATQWIDLFSQSGAKYVVITSKHHEGFTLWPSEHSWNWNSLDRGPKRDILNELSLAIKKTNLNFGVYYSLYEWYNPLYLKDKNNNFTTHYFTKNKLIPEMIDLVEKYKPKILWSDGDWEASEDYWESKQFLTWLYNDSPVKETIVVNDRWGINTSCHHGGYFSCIDRYNPRKSQMRKWENAMTLDRNSWGFSRLSLLEDYLSIEELLKQLIETISCGGNILINVGPSADGTISIIFQERLKQLGAWLKINKDAIYSSQKFKIQNDKLKNDLWYTIDKKKIIYGLFTIWPSSNKINLGLGNFVTNQTKISLLTKSGDQNLKYKINPKFITIYLNSSLLLENKWAWTIKINNNLNFKIK